MTELPSWDCGWLRGASDEGIRRSEAASLGVDAEASITLKCDKENCPVRIKTIAREGKAVEQNLIYDSETQSCRVYKGTPH